MWKWVFERELKIKVTQMYSPINDQQSCIDVRNEQYSLVSVISELSTVRCDRVLDLWLQVQGRRVSTVSCRGGDVADRLCGGRR